MLLFRREHRHPRNTLRLCGVRSAAVLFSGVRPSSGPVLGRSGFERRRVFLEWKRSCCRGWALLSSPTGGERNTDIRESFILAKILRRQNIQHPTSNAEHRTRRQAMLPWELDVGCSVLDVLLPLNPRPTPPRRGAAQVWPVPLLGGVRVGCVLASSLLVRDQGCSLSRDFLGLATNSNGPAPATRSKCIRNPHGRPPIAREMRPRSSKACR